MLQPSPPLSLRRARHNKSPTRSKLGLDELESRRAILLLVPVVGGRVVAVGAVRVGSVAVRLNIV